MKGYELHSNASSAVLLLSDVHCIFVGYCDPTSMILFTTRIYNFDLTYTLPVTKKLVRIVWHCMSGDVATEFAPRMWVNASATHAVEPLRVLPLFSEIVEWLQAYTVRIRANTRPN